MGLRNTPQPANAAATLEAKAAQRQAGQVGQVGQVGNFNPFRRSEKSFAGRFKGGLFVRWFGVKPARQGDTRGIQGILCRDFPTNRQTFIFSEK